MRRIRHRPAPWLVMSMALLAFSRPLSAAEIAGVTLPEMVEVGGRELRLNGTSLLEKVFFKVYVVALYLPEPAREAEAVVSPDVPKALIIQFLRSVSRESLVSALERGFATNAGEKGRRAETQIAKLMAALKDMKDGDRLTFSYVPGTGSTIRMTDGTIATFEGKDFADSVLLIYVGPNPPKAEMKRRLLGKT